MSRHAIKKRRYTKYKKQPFILDILRNKIMLGGSKTKSKFCILEIFKELSKLSKQNSFLVFLKAIYNVSPRIRVVQEFDLKALKLKPVKEQLLRIKSVRMGIALLLKNSKTQKGSKFASRCALEIFEASLGRGASVKKKIELEKSVLKKTEKDQFAILPV